MIYTILFIVILYLMVGVAFYQAVYAMMCSDFYKSAEGLHKDPEKETGQEMMDKAGIAGVIVTSIFWPVIITFRIIRFLVVLISMRG